MKKQILIFGATIGIVSAARAHDIPQNRFLTAIINGFNKQSPKTMDLEREMDDNGIKIDFKDYSINNLEHINDSIKVVCKKELNALTPQDRDATINVDGNVLNKITDQNFQNIC